jgi:membrane protein
VAAPPDHDRGAAPAAARLLVSLPGPLRPPVAWIADRPAGRILAGTASGLVRVQIFDRAMTLAAQAFTSLFPIFIMVGALFGAEQVSQFASLARMPASSRHLIDETLTDRGFGAFGVAGILVVLLSSTGLARALARAYGTVWEVPRVPRGPRAAWRWLLAVLVVAALLIGTRMSGWLTADLPRPRLWSGVLLFLVDCAVAVLLPVLLLHRAVPARMLLPGGLAFALVMLSVRPAGAVYLPRALDTSYERYGTIGLAFTYIGWLYVMAFCLLITAVLGQVVARDDSIAGRLFRNSRAPGVVAARAVAGTPGTGIPPEVAHMDTSQDSPVPQLSTVLGQRHWLRLVVGVLAIGVGAIALIWPSATVQVIGVLFGLNLLVTGAIRAGLLVFVPGFPVLYRVVGIVFGVLTAIVGILCLRNITASVVLLVVVVAIGWILSGLVEIFVAVGSPGEAGNNWNFITGLALVLAAIALLVWPQIGLTTFVAIGATVLVFVGIGQVIGAVAEMRAARRAPA